MVGAPTARVVVSGYYGFGNAGDETILAGLASALSDANVVVLSNDPGATEREHGVKAVHRFDPEAVLSALRGADLLVSGGGSLLQEATGPFSLPYYLGVIAAARAMARPVMVYAQGVGPLRSPWARRLVGRTLNGVQLITTRDQASAELLRACGVGQPPIEVTADAALSLPARPRVRRRGSPRIGIALRAWGRGDPTSHLAQAADRLARRYGATIVLVPMHFPRDLPAHRQLMARLSCPAELIDRPLGVPQLVEVFSSLDLVIGMRLHALILAAQARLPVVGLSYDPKIEAFLHGLNGPAPIDVAELGAGLLLDRVAAVFPLGDAARATLDARVTALEAAAGRNNRLLRELLASLQD